MSNIFRRKGWWLALLCVVISPCASKVAAPATPSEEKVFLTEEFTRPGLSIAGGSEVFYFDLLGEIYRVPIQGGQAERIPLGPGWKDLPVVSPDGAALAFRSDADGLSRIWVKSLRDDAAPVAVSGDGAIDPTDLVWGRGGTILSTGQDNLTAHRRTFHLSVSRVERDGTASHLMAGTTPQRDAPVLVGAVNEGRHVYLHAREINGFRVIDALTGQAETIADVLPPQASQVRLSPDGKFVGYTGDPSDPDALAVLDLLSRQRKVTRCALEPVWKEDGDDYVAATYVLAEQARFAVLARDGRFKRCPLDGEARDIPVVAEVRKHFAERLLPEWRQPLLPQILFPTIDARRGRLAYTMAEKVWVQDLSTRRSARLSSKDTFQTMPRYSRSGDRLAYVEIEDGVSRLLVVDSRSGKVSVVDESSTKVHANPAWAHCECKIAFALVDARPSAVHRADLMVLDLAGGGLERVTEADAISYTEGYHVVPHWDVDDAGLFYLVNGGAREGMQLVHHPFGGEANPVMRLDHEVLEFQPSPDDQRMALRYRGGIVVVPFSLVSDPARRLSYEELTSQPHHFRGVADFMAWMGPDELAWSIQDRMYTGTRSGGQTELTVVDAPIHAFLPVTGRRAYVGARLVTMRGDEVIDSGTLITDGPKVAYVGREPDAALLEDAEIIDVAGKTILPGLVDVHEHSLDDNYGNEPATGGFLFQLAAYGVTTAYDAAPRSLPQASTLSLVSSADTFNGATYYSAGPALLGAVGHQNAVRVDSLEEARRYVGRLALAGVPIVKEYLNPNPGQQQLIVQAASERGLGVTSHQRNARRVHFSTIDRGYTSVEHLLLRNTRRPFYSDGSQYLAASQVGITPTLVDADMAASMPFMHSVTPKDMRYQCLLDAGFHARLARAEAAASVAGEATAYPSWLKAQSAQYAGLLKAGVPISIGSHGSPHGLATHWEIWALYEGGASALEVIRAATVNGARKLNLQHRIGSLDAGMDADFLIVNGNPLDRIHDTADIWRVIRRGRPLQWRGGTRWPLSWGHVTPWASCSGWSMGAIATDTLASKAVQ